MKIAVIVPVFNERKHLQTVVKNLKKYNLPIIVVDDGSNDGSIKNISKNYVTILRHKINLGKGAAMRTGAEYAFRNNYNALIFIDSDGQHNPDDLPKFIEKIKTGRYSLVLGSRNYNYAIPLVRYLGNKFASLIISLLFHVYVTDSICGYRAITYDGYKKIKWDSSGYGVETEMLVRAGKTQIKFCEVPVETIYHDSVKGASLLDAIGILFEVIKWKLTI